jgi:hypothetical protein
VRAVHAPEGGLADDAFLHQVDALAGREGGLVNVVIPELFQRRSLRSALQRSPEFLFSVRLAEEPGIVVTHVPVMAGETPPPAVQRTSTEALVFVPEVDDAVFGAVAYARGIGAADARAIHVAIDPPAAERVKSDWKDSGIPLPLEVVEAPFRSLEQPVLETVRAVTSSPNKIALVVVPEILAGSWWQDLLHNERALYLGWLLRFEPRVVVSTVPLRRPL